MQLIRILQLFINAFFGKFLAVNQSDIHMATIENSRVVQCLNHGKICVRKLRIFFRD